MLDRPSLPDSEPQPSARRRWWQRAGGRGDEARIATPETDHDGWDERRAFRDDDGSLYWQDGHGRIYDSADAPYAVGDEPDEAAPKTRRSRWWWISRGLGAAALLFLIVLIWLAVTAPLSKSLQPIAPPQITLTASDGTPIARNGAIVDKPVEITKLPQYVPQAFMAIEDRRFYSHWGIDPRGLGRAFWSNMTSERTQGGSTITQQLAKFTFLSSDRTLIRKARELLIAFWLEARLSKDEILERYLSNVYFGDNVYGLRAASLHYFYRQPENLKPEQAIMLAGLVQAPSRFAPTKNWQLAEKRSRLVRGAMVDAGFMTQREIEALPAPRLDARIKNTLPTGTYFADWAMPQARGIAEQGYAKLTMQTTLDRRLQQLARRAISRSVPGGAEAALVAMRPNGEIVAMVGGRDYRTSAFNRATQAKRQPGSTFKLFVYLAALQSGMRPDDLIDNSEITQGSYRPKNASEKYSGDITLNEAFARSSNVAAVRLFGQVGDDAVIRVARDLGVASPLAPDDPSLALGTSTMTLIELTAAYAAVSANSYPVTPRAFAGEEEGWLDWLFSPARSFDGRVRDDMQRMLRYAVNSGTGRAARLRVANYGKTGTSQNNRDAIFVGYAGDLIVGVWVGNDDNSPLRGVNGGNVPARIWRSFMASAVKGAGQPAPRPKPPAKSDGPVKPLDLPEIPDLPELPELPQEIPLPQGNINIGGQDIRVDNTDGPSVSTDVDIQGFPVNIRVNRDGVNVRQRERERARE